MNKDKRRKLSVINDAISEVYESLQMLKDDEEDKIMNMPENLQESERYHAMEEAVEQMEAALDSLEEAMDGINEIIDE